MPSHPHKAAQRKRKQRRQAIAAGLCARCLKRPVTGRRYVACPVCRGVQARASKRWRKQFKAKLAALLELVTKAKGRQPCP